MRPEDDETGQCDYRCRGRPRRLYRNQRPTTHSDPTYIIDDVVHYCVANMPGAVGRTSTFALCNATLPYVIRLAGQGDAAPSGTLASALNIHRGEIVHQAVADAFNGAS